MRKILHSIVWIITFVMLTGCAKFEPQMNAVSVDKEGKLTRAFVDTFVDESNQPYDVEEIRGMMEEELEAYNRKFGLDHVLLKSCELKDGILTIQIECDAAKYYADYSSYYNDDFTTPEADVEFFVGTVAEAAGYDFSGKFTDSEGASVSATEILANEKLHVVVLNEPLLVNTPGKILYVSTNVEMLGDKQAQVKDQGQLARAYIIYK